MRIVPFIFSSIITIGLIVVFNVQLPAGGGQTPRLGYFLSPQHGCWQNAEPMDEDFNQTLSINGLQGNAEVYFDERLVPHVYAEHENDAYFIQGYLHAKFRLWQMEFQTHAAAGRLSEIMGEKSGPTDFTKIDKYFRRLGMVYAAEKSLEAIEANPVTKAEADAYTAGVNHYIADLKENQLPLEYKLLNYKPEPWSNLKTALFLKYMSYDLAGPENDLELTNARKIFSAAAIELLYPVFQDSLDPVIPRGTPVPPPGIALRRPESADSLYYNMNDTIEPALMLKPDKDNGSNNWAVSGSKTASGAPILCNDPHLGLNLPSLWYEMQITTPAFNAYGVSFPGAPSIIIGFNDSIAWGVTNAGRDVKDYFDIKFKDNTMQQYWMNGEWKNSTTRFEIIKVKGKPDIAERLVMTDFGPVMYDATYPSILKDGKAYAVRWKAHDPSNELMTFNQLNRAKNFIDFQLAIANFECPGQNMIFASKSGNIGLRQQGHFPAKWRRQGDFVMPGQDSSYMWQGIIPLSETPTLLNPERGFVSSANQKPYDESYPYYLGWDYSPYRGKIINRALSNMSSITPKDMQNLQTDNYNIFAEMARPVLFKYLDESKLTSNELEYVNKLKLWELRNDINETGATIFKVWWDSLEAVIWKDDFSQASYEFAWPDRFVLVEALLRDSAYRFVDDIHTPAVETINEMVMKAYKMAYPTLKLAEDENRLEWGKFKDTGVRHLTRLAALGRLHLPIGGGAQIINAAKQYHGPSWRMVVHLTDKTEAYGIYPGGQSGNPGSRHYDEFVDFWAQGKYYPLLVLSHDEARRSGQMKWKMTFTKA